MFLFIKSKVLFALDVMLSLWELHDRPLDMSTPSNHPDSSVGKASAFGTGRSLV